MNPHGWETFGDFAADAGPGILMFIALIALCAWVSNRRG